MIRSAILRVRVLLACLLLRGVVFTATAAPAPPDNIVSLAAYRVRRQEP